MTKMLYSFDDARMFYSFDDGRLYYLYDNYSLDKLMHEKCTQNGVLIYAENDKFEIVEYNGGNEVEFDTRFLIPLDNDTAVFRKSHIIGNKPKTTLTILKDDADNHLEFLRKVIEGM